MSRAAADYDYMSFDDFEEFLADKPKNERWELIGGRIVKMMVGARWEHNFIIQNIASAVRDRLRAAGSPCRTLTETFYLKAPALDASLLPDVIVHCGPLPSGAASVEAPTVVIEVMSDGTEARDRIAKWGVYQRIPSLMHCVLIAQDRPHVETLDRIGGEWRGLQIIDGLESVLPLPAINVEAPLSEIYRDVLGAS